jgi:hypothetical protein
MQNLRLRQDYRYISETFHWDLENLDEHRKEQYDVFESNFLEPLECAPPLKNFENAKFSVKFPYCKSVKHFDKLKLELNFNLVPKVPINRMFISISCWVTLIDGQTSNEIPFLQELKKSEFALGKIENCITFKIRTRNFKVFDEIFENTEVNLEYVSHLHFKIKLDLKLEEVPLQYRELSELDSFLEDLVYLDCRIAHAELLTSKAKAKLESESESKISFPCKDIKFTAENDEFVMIPCSLVHFSFEFQRLLSDDQPGVEVEREKSSPEIKVDAQFSIDDLKDFKILILGTRKLREVLFSYASASRLMKMHKFLDLYGLKDWKSIIEERILQVMPRSSENIKEWIEFLSWKEEQNRY